MDLLIASKNRGKIREIKKGLKSLKLKIIGLDDFSLAPSFEEKAESFAQNARDKALFYNKLYDILTVADDSGLMVDYLKGAPGVYSARFAAPYSDDKARIKKLLNLLKGISFEERQASFRCALAVAEGGKIVELIEERANGFILEKMRGKKGFGYDPVFYFPPLKKSFAQLSLSEKNEVSHRGKALTRLRQFLAQRLKQEEN